MKSQPEFIHAICDELGSSGIPYMIGGSVASSYHGPPRATNDVDIVIAPTSIQLDQLLAALSDYYVDRTAAHNAFRRRSMFNVIDTPSGNKADLMFLKQRPYSTEELRRRMLVQFVGKDVYVASPEDVILSKLEWSKLGESERQFQDAVKVALTKWPDLDVEYLGKWAVELEVSDALTELLKHVRELSPEP